MTKIFTFPFFVFTVLVLFTSILFAEGTKVKIYQAATVDLQKILNLVETDENFKKKLQDYQSIQSSNIAVINTTVQELESYLAENPDFSAEKKKEILSDISFQKSRLNALGGNNLEEGGDVFKILYEVIKQVAERRGFSMVIEKRTAIIYASKEIDITDQVIDRIKNKLQ